MELATLLEGHFLVDGLSEEGALEPVEDVVLVDFEDLDYSFFVEHGEGVEDLGGRVGLLERLDSEDCL